MVNYMDVQDKNGVTTRIYSNAGEKDENGKEYNTEASTGAKSGDRIKINLSGPPQIPTEQMAAIPLVMQRMKVGHLKRVDRIIIALAIMGH